MDESQTSKINLQEIQVRPIIPDEIVRFKELLSKHHYTGTPPMIGATICYVAAHKEQWVSLLCFSAASLK